MYKEDWYTAYYGYYNNAYYDYYQTKYMTKVNDSIAEIIADKAKAAKEAQLILDSLSASSSSTNSTMPADFNMDDLARL